MAILRGDFAAAFNFNQLVFFAPVLLAALYLAKRSKHSNNLTNFILLVAAITTLGFFLTRNNLVY